MLRLTPVPGEIDSYSLVSGDVVVGVLRSEGESQGAGVRWHFSLYAIHLEDSGIKKIGSADNLGDAFYLANQQWGEIISRLGLRYA